MSSRDKTQRFTNQYLAELQEAGKEPYNVTIYGSNIDSAIKWYAYDLHKLGIDTSRISVLSIVKTGQVPL